MKANHPLILGAVRRACRIYLGSAIVVIPFSLFMATAPLWSSEGSRCHTDWTVKRTIDSSKLNLNVAYGLDSGNGNWTDLSLARAAMQRCGGAG